MLTNEKPLKVLVVCLGNICRSPMGEAVLRRVAEERGIQIEVDSCGTAGYHAGDDPDNRTLSTCMKHDTPIHHRARQIKSSDFMTFTHILASDQSNLGRLRDFQPKNSTAQVRLWGSYLDGEPIPDPYYGGIDGFEKVYQQCNALSVAFLDQVTAKDT